MNKRTILTALIALSAVAANAQFLFRISGGGLKEPSYMLGTIHMLSGDLLDSIPAFLEAEKQCRQLYVETDVTNPQRKTDTKDMVNRVMTLPDSMKIFDVMGEEKSKLLKERMKEVCHIDLDNPGSKQMQNMQPFIFSLSLNMMMLIDVMKKFPAFGKGNMMDGACIARAKAREWKIGDLDQKMKEEDMDKIKEDFENSIDEQADTLAALLENFDERKQNMLKTYEGIDTMCDYWTKGDYEGFEEFIKKENEANPGLYGDRNKKWMPTITSAMEEAPTLFVFGAGHLTGPDGIVSQLRTAGYEVEIIKN